MIFHGHDLNTHTSIYTRSLYDLSLETISNKYNLILKTDNYRIYRGTRIKLQIPFILLPIFSIRLSSARHYLSLWMGDYLHNNLCGQFFYYGVDNDRYGKLNTKEK